MMNLRLGTLTLVSVAVVSGCQTTTRSGPRGEQRTVEPVARPAADITPSREVQAPTDRASPQANAAAALIAQARQMIEAGRWDQALTRLERAASINPRDGAGHYWLAEVWRAQGDKGQAREHHRLAKRYLAGQEGWADKLDRQAAAIK